MTDYGMMRDFFAPLRMTWVGYCPDLNLSWNAGISKLEARQWMDSNIQFNCMYNRYFDNSSPSYLLDPRYTMAQWQQNNMYNGGGMPFDWSNMGFFPGYRPGNADNNNNISETPEDEKFNKKTNLLLSLMKQLVKDAEKDDSKISLTDDEISALKFAIKNVNKNEKDDEGNTVKLTPEQKYNRLKEAFDKVNKDEVRNFIKTTELLTTDGKEVKSSAKDKTFYKELLAAGFEYDGTEVDNELNNMRNAIESLSNSNAKITGKSNILGDLGLNQNYNILDDWVK